MTCSCPAWLAGRRALRPRSQRRPSVAAIPAGASVQPITGGNWEGTGVQPDVEVAAEGALAVAHEAARRELAAAAPTSRSSTRVAQRGGTPAAGLDIPVANGDFAGGLAPWVVQELRAGRPSPFPHRLERGALC